MQLTYRGIPYQFPGQPSSQAAPASQAAELQFRGQRYRQNQQKSNAYRGWLQFLGLNYAY